MDQNFGEMDGIVNYDYYKSNSPAPPSIVSTMNNSTLVNSSNASEHIVNYIYFFLFVQLICISLELRNRTMGSTR